MFKFFFFLAALLAVTLAKPYAPVVSTYSHVVPSAYSAYQGYPAYGGYSGYSGYNALPYSSAYTAPVAYTSGVHGVYPYSAYKYY